VQEFITLLLQQPSVPSAHRVSALGSSGEVFLSYSGRALGESSIAASCMTKDADSAYDTLLLPLPGRINEMLYYQNTF